MNISILRLSRDTSEKELTKLFAKFGKVESCDIVVDKESGESKGFGFIKMAEDEKGKTAIKCLDGREVDGSIIKVKALTKTK
jgi:RNA recognition motif-containing protein